MVKKKDPLLTVLWAAAFCLMALLLFSHTYNDILVTAQHGMNFWNILFDGQILHFFEVNYVASGNAVYDMVQGCAYNILLYVIFAVWNIPLALLSAFTNVDVMNNIFCIAYIKLMTVAAMVYSVVILRRILRLLHVEEAKLELFSFLYLTSTLMVSVVFIISQYDLVSVVFQLLGFEAYLQKKDRKFILFFGIALCLKYFAVVLFVPLLLLRHKRIFAWIKSLVGLLIPLLLTTFPFINSYDRFATDLTDDYLSRLFAYGSSGFNWFVILFCFLLVWCFLREDEENSAVNAVWVAFAAYGLFFGLLDGYLYWAILMAPFVVLLMALMPQYLYLNLLLEALGYACVVLGHVFRYSNFFFGNTMKSMLMSRIVSEAALNYEGSLIYHIVRQLAGKAWSFPVCNSVFIAALAAMAYLAYPAKLPRERNGWQLTEACREAMILRFLITCGICMLPVLSLFI